MTHMDTWHMLELARGGVKEEGWKAVARITQAREAGSDIRKPKDRMLVIGGGLVSEPNRPEETRV